MSRKIGPRPRNKGLKSPIFLLKMDEAVLPPDMIHEIINWTDMSGFWALALTCRAGHQYCRKIAKKKIQGWKISEKTDYTYAEKLPNGTKIYTEFYTEKIYQFYNPITKIFIEIDNCSYEKWDYQLLMENCNSGDTIMIKTKNEELTKYKYENIKTRHSYIFEFYEMKSPEIDKNDVKGLKKLLKNYDIMPIIKKYPKFVFKCNLKNIRIDLNDYCIKYHFPIKNTKDFYGSLFNAIESRAGPEITQELILCVKNYLIKEGLKPEEFWPGFAQ